MKKISIFLASSNELQEEREKFEIEIYRKCKAWFDKEIFLYLDIWEDLSEKMSSTRTQDEYNQKIKQSDLFVLLVHTKLGIYSAEEFETALGSFKSNEKPFIFTYFKNASSPCESVDVFKGKLKELGHFPGSYDAFNDLWNKFSKELERLEINGFSEFEFSNDDQNEQRIINQGDKSIYIEATDNINLNIQ